MSDSLRGALETELRRQGVDEFFEVRGIAGALAAVAAAHPVEPECLGDNVCTNPKCPRHGVEPAGVSDEAVEAAAVAWAPFWATSTTDATRKAIRKQTRKALEAAQPFMGATPVASRCKNCDADTLACTACGARVEPWG